MIPYFEYHVMHLGPLPIQVWGLFAALGISVAVLIGRRVARRRGLDAELFTDLAAMLVLGGLIGGRVLQMLAYEPVSVIADPLSILRVWEGGMSFMGGFIGAAVACALAFRGTRYGDGAMKLRYANVAVYVLPLGYAIARIGCFLIHDHPGAPWNGFPAVAFPSGPRLDLGIIQSVFGFALFATFVLLERASDRWGATPAQRESARKDYLRLFLIVYGVERALSDTLRAADLAVSDTRYAGLTPAQYTGAAMLVVGLLWPSVRARIVGGTHKDGAT